MIIPSLERLQAMGGLIRIFSPRKKKETQGNMECMKVKKRQKSHFTVCSFPQGLIAVRNIA